MNFITYNDLNNCIINNMSKIPKDIDIVVGVPRSGLLVATMLSLYINVPVCDLESFISGRLIKCGTTKRQRTWINNVVDAKKVLIVEDSVNLGDAISSVKSSLADVYDNIEKIYLSIYVSPGKEKLVDIWFEKVEVPRMFEWNYLHHSDLLFACFDIDGVLCEDPSNEQNDDDKNYIDFIRNARCKLVPTAKIGYLITSRLEKYRDETEVWLKKNNISYNHLIMSAHTTKEERIKAGDHAEFKAKNYKKLKDTILFVESDSRQAEAISEQTGKMVFCVENQVVYGEKNTIKIKNLVRSKVKRLLPQKIINIIRKIR